MKKVYKRVGIVLGLIILLIGISIIGMFTNEKKQVASFEFSDIDMNKVVDGIYEGTSETTLVKATVSVAVENKEITKVQILRHDNGMGSSAEVIVDEMIKENTYDVDTISGATVSSTVLKNAVYKALLSGLK